MGHRYREVDLERAALQAYSQECLAYYDGYHPTSRYFDLLIDNYLRAEPLLVIPGSSWLEVGSGRGRLLTAARSGLAFRRCYLDISRPMLEHCTDKNGSFQTVGSAFRLPFREMSFDGAASFLGDAFDTEIYFREVFRILNPGGHFMHVVPTAVWGHTLRRHRGYNLDETVFIGRSGTLVRAPSVLHDARTLKNVVKKSGFTSVTTVPLPTSGTQAEAAPEDVCVVATTLGIPVQELPVLLVLRAQRS